MSWPSVLSRLFSLLVLFLLVGCRFDVAATLKAGDLRKVVETGVSYRVPMHFDFQIFGEDACSKFEQSVVPPFARAYGGAKMVSCLEDGFLRKVRMSVEVDVVHELADKKSNSDQALYLGVYRVDQGAGLRLSFFRNSDAFRVLVGELVSLDLKMPDGKLTPALSILLQNDLPVGLQLSLGEVFIDGVPRLASDVRPYTLQVSEEVAIALSDVAGALLYEQGGFEVAVAGLKPM